ncbi:hypothetical protein Purlil1_10438 [Purpureocillium lilacinum]|uniref:Uncharacterized protein n=1 Tax=Purpureocillium lilacinum TaxID=33203 RepID=A0ABR0BMI6_PURLI|nr:hypothetical protein Purlil1_10438 [Purpureocillium lilacinum]
MRRQILRCEKRAKAREMPRGVVAGMQQGSTHDTRHAGATNGRKSCLSTPYLTVHWLSIHPIARSKTWHGAGAGCFAPAESRQPVFDCLGATAPCQGHALSLGRRPERKKSFSCGIWSALAAERRTTTTSRARPTPSGRAPGPAPVPPCGAAALQALRPPKRQHKMIDTGRRPKKVVALPLHAKATGTRGVPSARLRRESAGRQSISLRKAPEPGTEYAVEQAESFVRARLASPPHDAWLWTRMILLCSTAAFILPPLNKHPSSVR